MSLFPRPEHIAAPPPAIPWSPSTVPGGLVLVPDKEAQEFLSPSPDQVWEIVKRYGSRVAFGKDGALTVLLTSAEANVQVMVEEPQAFTKGNAELIMSQAIGWGLIVEEGENHRRQQRALSPALRGKALKDYFGSTWDVARVFVEELAGRPEEPLVDWARRFTQTSAEKALFGTGDTKPNFRYQRDLLTLNDIAMGGLGSDFNHENSLQRARLFREAQRFTAQYVGRFAKRWLAGPSDSPSLLDVVMQNPDARGDGEHGLQGQLALFMQAAVETTASLVSWMLFALDKQARYWDELVREAATSPSASMGYRELAELPWHRAVIYETLRLYPPAWMFPRITVRARQIDGVELSPGTEVLLSPWMTHRNPLYFSGPEEFFPERWLDRQWKPPRGSFIPFGLGSRVCIGERYAKLTAATLLYQLSAHPARPRISYEGGGQMLASLISAPSPALMVTL